MKSEKLVKSEILEKLEKLEKSDIQKWKGRKVTQFGGFFFRYFPGGSKGIQIRP